MENKNIDELSPLALAFLGDAVHTVFVREKVLEGEKQKLITYHNKAKKFCNAKAQAETLEKILPDLSPAESEIVRRSRNAHNKHSAKNFDEETYKKATAFEALVGFLYLSKDEKRLKEILAMSMEEK